MANQEHFAILQQGVEGWNQWRKEHRDTHPDLEGSDFTDASLDDVRLSFSQLKEACFRNASLQRAYFVNSDLSNTDFRNAQLSEAHLDRARLKGANLCEANLQRAKIRIANLQGANLSRADLRFTQLDRTSFSAAHLQETDFHGARIRCAEFFNVDLSTAKGLDTIIHDGPSHLGIQTLTRSLEHLPPAFLQGAGVPDSMLAYAHSLRQKPIVYPTCFLSYATADQDMAEHLQSDLRAHDVFCWSAPYDSPQEEKQTRIETPLVVSDVLLLMISEHSMTEASHRALNSIIKKTLLKERRGLTPLLIPLALNQDVQEMRGIWPRLLHQANYQSRDVSHWKDSHRYKELLHQLLRDLLLREIA